MLADEVMELAARESAQISSARILRDAMAIHGANPYTRVVSAGIRDARRLSLSRDLAAAAAELAFGNPAAVLDALPSLRLPDKATWLEFSDRDFSEGLKRLAARRGEADETLTAAQGRSGFLLIDDEVSIRSYVVTHRGAAVTIAHGHGEFFPSGPVAELSDTDRSTLLCMWDDPRQGAAMAALLERFRIGQMAMFRSWMEAWVRAGHIETSTGEQIRDSHLGWVNREMRRVLAFVALLNLPLEARGSDLEKLNKARAKSGRSPLLAHEELRLPAHLAGADWCRGAFAGTSDGLTWLAA